jgi:phytoene dehydrogenase-like protein
MAFSEYSKGVGTMQKKSILIIGGGIAGLSAGCYAQMNGYDSQVFELHTLPGGLCTAWSRKGYTFDGCIHWLMGTGEGKQVNSIWKELGALDGKEIVDHEAYIHVHSKDGRTLILYTNVDRLEKHMLELAPEDSKLIREMARAVRKLQNFQPPMGKPAELMTGIDALKMLPAMLPAMPTLKKFGSMTLDEYAAKFKSSLIREALISMVMGLSGFPAIGILMMLSYMSDRNAGYPLGGSLPFAQNIEKRYQALGGKIRYKSRVEKILVEDDRAVGVRLKNGSEFRGDVVISAADGHATIFNMLDGKYITDEIQKYYETFPIFRPLVMVSMGVDRDLSDVPHMAAYLLDKPITIAGEQRDVISIKHFCYDPSLAPKGKSIVQVMYDCDYSYWKPLEENSEHYEAEKKQAALTVMEQVEKFIPGFIEKVEVVDVATPLTFERYTGNWQGSMEGWMLTTKTMNMQMSGKSMSKTLSGLENFYMIGQWVEPGGGVPTAALSARNVMQLICHKDTKEFSAQIP